MERDGEEEEEEVCAAGANKHSSLFLALPHLTLTQKGRKRERRHLFFPPPPPQSPEMEQKQTDGEEKSAILRCPEWDAAKPEVETQN